MAATWGDWTAFLDAACRFLFANWILAATCLLAAALPLSRLPRLRPSLRHAVLAAALLLAALAPLSHLTPLPIHIRVPTPAIPRSAATTAPASVTSTPAAPHKRASGQAAASPTLHFALCTLHFALPRNTGLMLLALWALIAAVRLAALAHGSWSVARWRRSATPVPRGRLYDACGYGIADIPVLESDRVKVPCVTGVFQPCILLPEGMAAALSLEDLRHVLLHEEGHARRRDPLFFCLAALAHALLFWHPLAGLVRRQMETVAEDACDASVLSRGVDGPMYARTLLTVLEHATAARPRHATCPFGAGGSSELRRRVVGILSGLPPASQAMAALASGTFAVVAGSGMLAELGSRPRLPRFRAGAGSQARAGAPNLAPSASDHRREAVLPRPRRTVRARRSVVWVKQVLAAAPRPQSEPAARPVPPLPRLAAAPAALKVELEGEGPQLASARESAPRSSRCVVFLLDVSSRMQAHQAQARDQVRMMVRRLAPGDRFNVLAFAGRVIPFAGYPVSPNDSSFAGLDDWMSSLGDEPGADLAGGLARALATPEVTSVVLVSDQEAAPCSAGWRRVRTLVERQNPCGAVILTLTLGGDGFPAGQTASVCPARSIDTLRAGETGQDVDAE